jgi:allantoinase
MPRIAALGLPLLVHAETPGPIETATVEARERLARGPELVGSHHVWLASRPPSAESEAIDLLAELALATGCRVHVVHVSSAEGVDRVAAAKEAGAPLTAETCPHYLTFDGEAIPAGAVEYKCAPPIRGGRHRDALWRALRGGTLDLVATDHSPCSPELKMDAPGGFFGAWGGIASLGLALPALWSSSEARGVSLPDIACWMSAEPARLAGIGRSKGAIREGLDADLVIFDPEAEYELAAGDLRFRHPITPYLGACMKGRIVHTLSRGRCVFSAAPIAVPSSWPAGSPGGGTWLR